MCPLNFQHTLAGYSWSHWDAQWTRSGQIHRDPQLLTLNPSNGVCKEVGIVVVLMASWTCVGKRAWHDSDVTACGVYLGSQLGSCDWDNKSH